MPAFLISLCGLDADDWTLTGTALTPTNLVSDPRELDAATWTKQRCSVDANDAIDPDGTQLADKVKEDTSLGMHLVFSESFSLTASTEYVFSVFVKAAGRAQGQLCMVGPWYSPAVDQRIRYDLSDGSIYSSTSKITQSGIIDVGNGWYLVYGVTTPDVTSSRPIRLILSSRNGIDGYTGDGSSGQYFYSCEVIEGDFPSFANNPKELDVTITDNPPSATLEDDWLSNGIVYVPGANWEVRHIVRSIRQSSTVQRLRLQRPFVNPLTTVYMRPFCGGTWAECKTKYSNQINFRGHPRAPRLNPSLPRPTTQQVFAKK